ncbi:glycosyltransferase family 4 protein [Mesobacillus subterraneus]|uniref:glycosyltransferase n=1 Tax=Mesobacillus subterraneus TaxID=285983 RepID=UPI0020419C37|nr:glycosyltransferase [Mesobacillus subterraneus]MCM3663641.1 glycosyltransferase family 4 protein [Mesobacillus subterraneus]MCM3683406.1 glycosyltransferase family 4 protein [Mesobacillus subterraneus]
MAKILVLTTLLPYPLDNGGKIKTYNSIKALSKNYEIDLICFSNDKINEQHVKKVQEITSSLEVIPKTVIRGASTKIFLKDYIKSLFSKTPYSIHKFYDKRFVEVLKKKLQEQNYEFIYFDHLPMMVYYKFIRNHKVILDQHNVESLIFKRIVMNDGNLFKKAAGFIEFVKLQRFEKGALNKANHVICLSNDDKNVFVKQLKTPENKLTILPIHLSVEKQFKFKPITNGELNILFLGSMSWYPNQHGIKWFMENVWGEINENCKIYIVGSNPPALIKNYHNNKNVFVTGYVDDVNDYIEICDISIVPLFVGSGQRVKIIESFGKLIPVISTSIGAEGIKHKNNKDILIADHKEEFIKEINKLMKYPEKLGELSENAFINFKENYSAEFLPDKLKIIINKIIERNG